MPIQQQAIIPIEADFEAEVHNALKMAFPWVPASDLKHQVKFSVKFGHAVVEVDGGAEPAFELRPVLATLGHLVDYLI
jgi:hypothetical protein